MIQKLLSFVSNKSKQNVMECSNGILQDKWVSGALWQSKSRKNIALKFWQWTANMPHEHQNFSQDVEIWDEFLGTWDVLERRASNTIKFSISLSCGTDQWSKAFSANQNLPVAWIVMKRISCLLDLPFLLLQEAQWSSSTLGDELKVIQGAKQKQNHWELL